MSTSMRASLMSTLPFWSMSHVPDGAGGSQVGGIRGLSSSDHLRIFPVELAWRSWTKSRHVPLGFSPLKPDRGSDGLNVPVKGPTAGGPIKAVPASSKTVLQKLLLPAPSWLQTTTGVPSGAMRVIFRSPTAVWSSPTVVEPGVLLQTVPLKRKTTLPIVGAPLTFSVALAPLLLLSGIGTTAPL